MPISFELSLPFRFSEKNFVPISHLIRATLPTHLIRLDFITQMIFGEVYKLQKSKEGVLDYTDTCSYIDIPHTENGIHNNTKTACALQTR
jgi:hypothetical protein